MSNQRAKKELAKSLDAAVAPKAEPKAEAVPTYSKADLIENAAVFNVLPEVMAGALYETEQATEDEVKTLITDFLEKPKEDEEKGDN